MVKFLDSKERETEILNLIIDSYINESKPISSSYLCEKYNLPCSSATVRSVMVSLEKKGLLSHLHTSSGRVPTQEGFKYYVERLSEEDFIKEDYAADIDFYSPQAHDLEEAVNYMLNSLAEISGYTSLVAVSGKDARVFFKGTRFILEQPEFEDIERIRNLFYAFEVKMDRFQEALFRGFNERVHILIGDDIGFEEMSECALVISGLRETQLSVALGLLGPVRMNYSRAGSCLNSIKNKLREIIGELG